MIDLVLIQRRWITSVNIARSWHRFWSQPGYYEYENEALKATEGWKLSYKENTIVVLTAYTTESSLQSTKNIELLLRWAAWLGKVLMTVLKNDWRHRRRKVYQMSRKVVEKTEVQYCTSDTCTKTQWIAEKAKRKNKEIFNCFIDFQRAFDTLMRMWHGLFWNRMGWAYNEWLDYKKNHKWKKS